MTREEAIKILKDLSDCSYIGSLASEDIEALKMAIQALEQEPILDKIRAQLKSHLRGVEITLEVLVENDPLRPKFEGAKETLEDCLELIDKAETENEDGEN